MDKIKNFFGRFTREQKIAAAVAAGVLISMILIMTIISGLFRSSAEVPAMAQEAEAPEEIPAPTVQKCEYDTENIITREGFKYYYENDEIRSHVGIDVSFAQKEIDWKKVKEAGVEFAMVRLGYRGYETGLLHEDEFFSRNMAGAMDAGIETGVYFFSQAADPDEAREEARFVLDRIGRYNITFPVAFDWEPITGNAARTDSVSGEVLTECALAFCSEIQKAGYMPVIYASLNLLREQYHMYDVNAISGYDLWLAEYKTVPEYPYRYKMWQYASDGAVAGINTSIDLNMYFY